MKTNKYFLIVLMLLGVMCSLQSANVHHYKSNGTGVTVDLNSANGWLINTGSGYSTATQAPVATGTDKVVSGDSIIIQKGDTWDNTTAGTTQVPGGVAFLHMGFTGNSFSPSNKVWFYSPTKVVFKSTLNSDTITIPYAVYAGIDIPTGSNAKYLNSTGLQIGAQTSEAVLIVNGSLKLARVNGINCGALKLYSQASPAKQSQFTGSGIVNIQSSGKLQFGLNYGGCQPILFNFKGTFAPGGQGIIVYKEGVQLQTNFNNIGQAYFGDAAAYIDLNGFTFTTGSIAGKSDALNFKNTLSGSLVVTGNTAAIGSADGLPFMNISIDRSPLPPGYTFVNSDITINNSFKSRATLNANTPVVIHIPINHSAIGGTTETNVTLIKDIKLNSEPKK